MSNFTNISHRNGNSSISDSSGQGVAAFLNELRPQSIKSFDSSTYRSLGLEVFQALACHEGSLTELKLELGSKETLLNLALLKGCTNLVSLSLTGFTLYYTKLEMSRNNAIREIFTWLLECKRLRKLASKSTNLPRWITPILVENGIHLTSLECGSSEMGGSPSEFYQALASQTSLQSLWLKGHLERFAVKPAVMVKCLSKLVLLKDLRLEEISKSFMDQHIVQLAGSLPKLEGWSTHGLMLTDAIWSGVESLGSLQRLELRSSASFTASGILDLIYKLKHGNTGLVLRVIHEGQNSEENEEDEDDEYDEDDEDDEEDGDQKVFSWEEQDYIQKMIAMRVNGRFELVMSEDI